MGVAFNTALMVLVPKLMGQVNLEQASLSAIVFEAVENVADIVVSMVG